MVHGSFHSGFLIIDSQDDMKAGHAWRKSSLSHPGKALNEAGFNNCFGCSAGGAACGRATGGETGEAGAVARGGVVQAVMPSATKTTDASKLVRVNDIGNDDMWLLMLEAGVALFLLVFIVWWTMFSGKKPTPPERNALPPKDDVKH
jgi:hypothetical protein